MIKPVFLLWAHREMWGIITHICKELEDGVDSFNLKNKSALSIKAKALDIMLKKYRRINAGIGYSIVGSKVNIVQTESSDTKYPAYMLCFACQSSLMLPLARNKVHVGETWLCQTRLCPLDWNAYNAMLPPIYGCSTYGYVDTIKDKVKYSDGWYRLWYENIEYITAHSSNSMRCSIPASKLATMIGNLPLSRYANLLYEIEEYPGQLNCLTLKTVLI